MLQIPLGYSRQNKDRKTRKKYISQTYRDYKINLHMIYHSKGLDLEITDFENHDDWTLPCEIVRGYHFTMRDVS